MNTKTSKYANLFDFANLTPEIIREKTEKTLEKAQGMVDEILSVGGERTVENTLYKLEEVYISLDIASSLNLVAKTHPEDKVQESADDSVQSVTKFATGLLLNPELYRAVSQVDISNADSTVKRFWEKEIRKFKRLGVDRDENTRKRVRSLRDREEELGNKFERNIRKSQSSIEVDPEELDGLPESYTKSHQPGENNKVVITTDYPDALPFLRFSRSEDARRRLYLEMRNRAYPENEEVLRELIGVRQELAGLLDYENFVDYVTEEHMLHPASAVRDFLDELNEMTEEHAKREYNLLLNLKKENNPDAEDLHMWDHGFYSELYTREKFGLNSQDLMPYFEYDSVKEGIFELTRRLFNVDYRKVENARVWHESVECYELIDKENGEPWGRFYMDMHPREGKFSHAASFPVSVGVESVQLPEAALVCNFPDPRKEDHALMQYSDVQTFLHEFGHLLHNLFGGHTKRVEFSGIATEEDFVEAPSQMLEEFLKSTRTLQTFALHHKTKEPIPEELVKKTIEADAFGRGMFMRRQAGLADLSFSLYFCDVESYEFKELDREIHNKYEFCQYPDNSHFWCSFGHLNDYSAAYYTYMWSKVIALDLFSAFEKNNLLDRETAVLYRKKVLEPGGTKDAADMINDFLGRPYNFDATRMWLRQSREG